MNTSTFSLNPIISYQNPQVPPEGKPAYPLAAYEITLLTQGQSKVNKQEMTFFEHLTDHYQWRVGTKQRQQYLTGIQQGFTLILTDQAKLIQWTTANFLSMTGYSPREVLGQTPRMLQGPLTDSVLARQVGDSLRAEQAIRADLLNYRKGGQPYMCRLQIDPLRNQEGEVTHYMALAIECEPTAGFRLSGRRLK